MYYCNDLSTQEEYLDNKDLDNRDLEDDWGWFVDIEMPIIEILINKNNEKQKKYISKLSTIMESSQIEDIEKKKEINLWFIEITSLIIFIIFAFIVI